MFPARLKCEPSPLSLRLTFVYNVTPYPVDIRAHYDIAALRRAARHARQIEREGLGGKERAVPRFRA